MRIGVDAACWSNRRGYGRFTRCLLTALADVDRDNDYVFFIDHQSEEFPLADGIDVIRVDASKPAVEAAAANGRRSLADISAMRRAIRREKLDLMFFPSVYSYVPLATPAPKLVTIHDVIPKLYPELVFPTLRSKVFWGAKVWLGCVQARLVITVSDYASRCLAEHMRIPRARLRVVNEASEPVFHRLERPDAPRLWGKLGVSGIGRFIAYVGGLSPHKNLSLLVDVFRELQAQPAFADLHLVLAGDYRGDVFYSCYSQLRKQVQRAGLQDRIVFTGYLGDEDLVILLNLAEALVLPSFCEGFGLPAVEAAACGTPVVVTTESPLLDLLGEGAFAVPPEDHGGWREAIARILSGPELRRQMGAAGLTAAARLSWKNSARQLLSIFAEVVDARGTTS